MIEIASGKVAVDREWYDRAVRALSASAGCPFCLSARPFVVDHENDSTFFPRRGCLDCDRWIDKVVLRP